MRIIDNKGRLFGVINLIDLFVLALIVVLAASVITNPLLRAKAKAKDNIETDIKVLFTDIADEVAGNKKVLKEGDLVLGGNAVVRGVSYARAAKAGYSTATVLLRARCVDLGGELYCANIPVKINSSCAISNPIYAFTNGVILDFEPVGKKADDEAR